MAMSNKPPDRIPRLLRGSLVTLRRRCGKPSCRCADGEQLHEAPALSYSEGGRTRMLTLADADVPAVAAALERYRAARSELAGRRTPGWPRWPTGSPRTGSPAIVRGGVGECVDGAAGDTRMVFRAPSFALFADLLVGWVCAPGRRTITAMIAVADPAGRRAHDAYHRFVRDGAWAMTGCGGCSPRTRSAGSPRPACSPWTVTTRCSTRPGPRSRAPGCSGMRCAPPCAASSTRSG